MSSLARYASKNKGRYASSRSRPSSSNTGSRARQREAARMAKAFSAPSQAQARAITNARIGGYLGIERKFYDTFLQNSNINAPSDASAMEKDPATYLCISAPGQGDGESNRDGRQITVDSCYVTGAVNWKPASDQADLPAGAVVAVWLVMDMQTNGAQLNSEDVFENPGADTDLAPFVFRDMQYINRFKVLDKALIEFPPIPGGTDAANTNSTAGCQRAFKLSYQKPFIVNFIGTSAGVANVADTSIHVLAAATETGTEIVYNSRMRFRG